MIDLNGEGYKYEGIGQAQKKKKEKKKYEKENGIMIFPSVYKQFLQRYGNKCNLTPGVGDGQGGLACCDSWGRKESDTTE